jgi:hypothetical protein
MRKPATIHQARRTIPMKGAAMMRRMENKVLKKSEKNSFMGLEYGFF